jgi:hypothetical protein
VQQADICMLITSYWDEYSTGVGRPSHWLLAAAANCSFPRVGLTNTTTASLATLVPGSNPLPTARVRFNFLDTRKTGCDVLATV